MTSIKTALRAIVFVSMLSGGAAHAALLQTSDFIDDGSRTGYTGFESLPSVYSGSTFSDDGIVVQQVNGDPWGYGIWTECPSCFGGPGNGAHSWYPNGGDFGYTKLTREDGSDFVNLGFLRGSGNYTAAATVYFMYELWNDGVRLQDGFFEVAQGTSSYVGFSGGGFDEVRLRDTSSTGDRSFLDGTTNALALDDIEISGEVPEPGMLGFLGLGLLFVFRRKV